MITTIPKEERRPVMGDVDRDECGGRIRRLLTAYGCLVGAKPTEPLSELAIEFLADLMHLAHLEDWDLEHLLDCAWRLFDGEDPEYVEEPPPPAQTGRRRPDQRPLPAKKG